MCIYIYSYIYIYYYLPSGMQTRTLKIEKMYARPMLVVFLTFPVLDTSMLV